MEGDAACIFFKAVLILCKREAGASSTMQLLLIERSRAPVSLIRACPWAWKENSNSYWSNQARHLSRFAGDGTKSRRSLG